MATAQPLEEGGFSEDCLHTPQPGAATALPGVGAYGPKQQIKPSKTREAQTLA